jgi:hypothetical protein
MVTAMTIHTYTNFMSLLDYREHGRYFLSREVIVPGKLNCVEIKIHNDAIFYVCDDNDVHFVLDQHT